MVRVAHLHSFHVHIEILLVTSHYNRVQKRTEPLWTLGVNVHVHKQEYTSQPCTKSCHVPKCGGRCWMNKLAFLWGLTICCLTELQPVSFADLSDLSNLPELQGGGTIFEAIEAEINEDSNPIIRDMKDQCSRDQLDYCVGEAWKSKEHTMCKFCVSQGFT